MKKILYIWLVLSAFITVSCDDETTVVQMSNEKATLTVSGISPKRGYQGTLVTITGSYFGVSEEFVKVFFNGSEEKAEVISCEDDKIVVRVPEGATSGTITLEVLNQKLVTSDVTFSVVGDPKFTGLSPESAYMGDEITISGENFGDVAEDVTLFCEVAGEKVFFTVKSCKDNEIKTVVPTILAYGDLELKMEIAGRRAVNSQTINILEKVTIVSVSSDSKLANGRLVTVGTNVNITGTAFGTDVNAVSVKFGDLDAASIVSCENNKIVAVVPEGFTGGKVTVTKDDISSTSEDELKVLVDGMDISSVALIDATNPKSKELTDKQAGTNTTLGIPANWEYTPNMINKKNNGGDDWVGLLEFNAETGNIFTIGAGWNAPYVEPTDEVTPNLNYIKNGKMYQKTTLPAGNYTLSINVISHGHSGSELHYVVSKAEEAFPDYNNVGENNGVVIASKSDNVSAADAAAYEVSFNFDLHAETEVYIGVVVNFTPNIWYNFEGFKLTYNHAN